jgi:hypothetical protein
MLQRGGCAGFCNGAGYTGFWSCMILRAEPTWGNCVMPAHFWLHSARKFVYHDNISLGGADSVKLKLLQVVSRINGVNNVTEFARVIMYCHL